MRMTTQSGCRPTRGISEATAGALVTRALLFMVLMLYVQTKTSDATAGMAPESPRERISFNAGWRFLKGDAPGAEGQLAYQKIKNWVTATGNEFALGADSVKGTRPEGNLGTDIAFAQRMFDDSDWRQLNLPHDWGIEGPFKQEYSGETGKLPWSGVAWYRKHFTAPAAERGKRFYLEIDGAMAYSAVWLNGRFVGGWPYGYASFEL